jgi:hypothetical protein
MPEERIDPREYREAARFIENAALEAFTFYSEISLTPVVGDLQYFPRPTAEARAAERGLLLLREQADEVVATLYALAAAAEQSAAENGPPPVPLVLRLLVLPYVEAFRKRGQE